MSGPGILNSYPPPSVDYDEFVDAKGSIRPPWKRVAALLRALPEGEFARRNQLLNRLITDNGITYNVYSADEDSRQWTMDLLPLVFSQTEWDQLEWKLQQRAELLNQVLGDLYGEQKSLRDGALPPYLVYANPAFLRSCYQIQPLGDRFINLYAADIARSPDGNWWVLNDRVEAASGMGYVLENRMLSNRIFPELFRDLRVKRLKPYYDKVFDAFTSLNPAGGQDQRVALLTPGPANETYFEQSFLSKNLGFHLVEGADLTVRENQLFFKTLNGIRPIHTLIRRLDSDWCDPLELRNESLLGVPGLLNCLREKNLALVNMIGTGLMETVAIPAFMNSLCQYFRNEDLRMPSVATWWCGQGRELDFVLDNLEHLVIKRTFRRRYDKAIFGPGMNSRQLDELRDRIRQSPEDYSAQELVSRATAPVYHDHALHPHHFLIRVYLVRMNDSFKLLPGALARIAPAPGSTSVSMQHGATSKDVWIINDKKDAPVEMSPERETKTGVPRPSEDIISSRTANNMYWLGRYIERIECLARQLRIIILSLTEDYHQDNLHTLKAFVSLLLTEQEFKSIWAEEDPQKKIRLIDEALQKYVWDKKFLSSLTSGFNHVQRIAFSIKDRLSTDTWQILDSIKGISLAKKQDRPDIIHERSIEALEETIDWLSAFSGMTAENMSQTFGWHFMMMGRRIERSHNILETVRHSVVENPAQEEAHLKRMLEYADSTITYRNRYLNHFDPAAVASLLLKDPKNPRSLSFNIERIINHVGSIPWTSSDTGESQPGAAQQMCSELIESMNRLNPESLFDGKLESYFVPIEQSLNQLHTTIDKHFFAHT